ncbi:MAG: hypothetical protein K2Z81_07265, partial [Cyanobacteria bacterium]|nr:hypothetical protein [Cyanobacteriota bacterium]
MLEDYNRKRDFDKTKEPPGKKKSGRAKHLSFVVQKHDARRLHYDFRLECDGVLLSWAVPKGPSLNPQDKRLAVRTEDHPFEYKEFEGAIPPKQYGAGEVIIWDRGFFSPADIDPEHMTREESEKLLRKGLADGKISVVLLGEKLKGSWALVRMKKEDNQWLLIKHADQYSSASVDITEEDRSVVTGRTLADLKSESKGNNGGTRTGNGKSGMSNEAKKPGKQTKSHKKSAHKELVHDEDIAEVLEQLENITKENLSIVVGSHEIAVSNLNKALWPGDAEPITKRHYIQYLCHISSYLLPHLHGRPITFIRYPNGVQGKMFFQKHWNYKLPEFVETVDLFSEHNKKDGQYILCSNLPTLIWLGQLADLELHVTHTRIDPEPDGEGKPLIFTGSAANIDKSLMNYPDYMVVDLDPYLYSGKEGKGAEPELHRDGFKQTCEIALATKDILDKLGLTTFVKTSGKTGLHIYIPIVRDLPYETVRRITEILGRHLLTEYGDKMTMEWAVKKRTGKIFFDHNMNAR